MKPSTSTNYVAFLRGINVGGNKKINMAALRVALEAAGLQNVRTLIASGNVLFTSRTTDLAKLCRQIEAAIQKKFAMEVSVILRTEREIPKLCAAAPFSGIKPAANVRLFVTFLDAKPKSRLKIPYLSPDGSYRIHFLRDRNLCSILTLGPQWSKNLRQMDILEKEFGKRITTRSWSTVCKCLAALQPGVRVDKGEKETKGRHV